MALFAAAVLVLVVASPANGQEDDGAQVYQETCASCHQADGAGIAGAFPPLAGNPNAGDPAYVADVIRNGLQGPIDVAGQAFDAVMPPVATLSDAQIEAVAAYVAGIAASTDAPAATVPAGPVIGDAANGENLFIGRSTLENGGPACSACHAAGSLAQGGAGLGPDLTAAGARLGGEAGLIGWLANPATVTMQPLFADHPLSETERADISAFLVAAEGESAAGADWFPWLGLLGAALLVAAVAVATRRSGQTYNDRLRSAR